MYFGKWVKTSDMCNAGRQWKINRPYYVGTKKDKAGNFNEETSLKTAEEYSQKTFPDYYLQKSYINGQFNGICDLELQKVTMQINPTLLTEKTVDCLKVRCFTPLQYHWHCSYGIALSERRKQKRWRRRRV